MTYNTSELLAKLRDILSHTENEAVEVKEARNNKNFNDIGRYFSALSNEANLHGKQEGWPVFGVADDMSICGTDFRNNEKSLEPGYKPPYYRNMFLCNAMVNLYMIDSNAIGIPTMFEIQRNRYFPLPSYDLSEPNRVKVTVHGKIIDRNYTQLLNADRNLDLQTVFLPDKIQKKRDHSKGRLSTPS